MRLLGRLLKRALMHDEVRYFSSHRSEESNTLNHDISDSHRTNLVHDRTQREPQQLTHFTKIRQTAGPHQGLRVFDTCQQGWQ